MIWNLFSQWHWTNSISQWLFESLCSQLQKANSVSQWSLGRVCSKSPFKVFEAQVQLARNHKKSIRPTPYALSLVKPYLRTNTYTPLSWKESSSPAVAARVFILWPERSVSSWCLCTTSRWSTTHCQPYWSVESKTFSSSPRRMTFLGFSDC